MERRRLESILAVFSRQKVAVIGDIMLDNYIYGIPRHNPESDSPCLTIIKNEDYRLGGAANAARNLASLGARVYLYGITGNDKYGEIIEGLCSEAGIALRAINSGETLRKSRVLGGRFSHPLFRLDFGEYEENVRLLGEEDESFIVSEVTKNIACIDGILMPDYDKRVLRGMIAQKIISLSKKHGVLTMADPKVKNPGDADKFLGIDVAKPNLQEARLLVGDEKGLFSYEELVQKLQKRMQSQYAVITCGKDGAFTYDGEYHYVPTKAREVSDVSGAGDTTAATLMLGLLSGATIVEAMHIANYAAGIVVEKAGTAAITREEIIERIRQENPADLKI